MNPYGLIPHSLTRAKDGFPPAKWTPRKRLLTRFNSRPAVAISLPLALGRCSPRLINLAWASWKQNFSAKRGEGGASRLSLRMNSMIRMRSY